MKSGLVLGIESSCDETAAAVVEGGVKILSSKVASQAALHAPFRGVVPELAARAHERAVVPMVRAALQEAGCGLSDLDGIAVTVKPGLIGALLVGLSAAKALALSADLPLTGVDHIEAHVYSCRMGDAPAPQGRVLALVASGGHTALFRVEGLFSHEIIGTTVDDAAGEAFDKAAGMLGLPYPGGAPVERAAAGARPEVTFKVANVKGKPFHFSFSGLKTALLYHLRKKGWNALDGNAPPPDALPSLAASFQESVVRALVGATMRAAGDVRPDAVFLAGGVALNRRLRAAMSSELSQRGIPFFHPRDILCGDNAAMIAGLGFHRLKAFGDDGLLIDASPKAVLRLKSGQTPL